jgi:hypothetical protein
MYGVMYRQMTDYASPYTGAYSTFSLAGPTTEPSAAPKG